MKKAIFLFVVSMFMVLSTKAIGEDLNLDNRGVRLEKKASRIALVIGNGEYKNSPLRNPVNDASDIALTLSHLGFKVILKLNVSHREMKEAVLQFGQRLSHGGVGLFYYAGHGMQLGGKNYLIPIDCHLESESDVEFGALNASRVLGKMEDAGNELNIVILDACRNNPFARSFRSFNAGLARMDAPKGTLIAYATAPGAVASDGNGRNGIYTKYFLENIGKPGLTIEKVFKNVRISVLKETENKQIPWESSSLTGDFYFNKSGKVNQSELSLKAKAVVVKHHGLEVLPNKIGLSGRYLAISTENCKFKYLFNMNKMDFENDKYPYYSYVDYKRFWKDYSLRLKDGRALSDTLELRKLGAIEKYISLNGQKHGSIRVFAFTDHGNILIGTDKGYIFLCDREGNYLQKFQFEKLPLRYCVVEGRTMAVLYDNGHIIVFKNLEESFCDYTAISLVR